MQGRIALKVAVFVLLLAFPFQAASISAAKVNLKFAMWMSATGSAGSELPNQLKLLDKYMDLNPDVHIEFYQQGWGGYQEKLLTMAAGGVAPDVMVLSRLWVPQFADAGVIQPIDKWYNSESEQFHQNIIEMLSGTYNGKAYGIPIWGGPTLVEYNANLFENAGVPQPVDLAKKKDWTYNKFVEYGKKITKDTNGDGTREVFMSQKLGTSQQDWYMKLRAMGGDVITPDGKPFTDVGAIEKGLQFWQDIAFQYGISPINKESADFLKGNQATFFNWVSNVPNRKSLVNNAFRMEITTPPTGPAGPFTLVGGCPIAISSTSANAYEAYKFAKWYAVESRHWELRGSPATWSEMRTSYREYLSTMFSWPEAVVEAMSGNVAMEPGIGVKYNDLNNAWNAALGAVANGTMAAREAATRIVDASVRILGGK